MAESEVARIKAHIKHPIVDMDGHWLESGAVFLEFLREVAGPKLTDEFIASPFRNNNGWYDATPEERQRRRLSRSTWWSAPTNTLDFATASIPGLFANRMDELGLDFTVLYPSMGLFMAGQREDLRRACVRAYNTMVAELFRPHRDRIAPAAVIPNNTPEEAIDEARYVVRELGLKAVVMGGTVRRETPEGRMYIDALGLDNMYDYDPVWQTFVDLGVAATSHAGSAGWPDRSSPTNFVFNHIGHFAQGNMTYCKALFMGGVPRRFPNLNFCFLEGGVAGFRWLLTEILGHWEKRRGQAANDWLKPANLDVPRLTELMREYGDERYQRHAEDIWDPFDHPGKRITPQQQTDREPADLLDEFRFVNASSKKEIAELFARNFYFGCEADDPLTTLAFDPRLGIKLKACVSSDVGHWDVPHLDEVLPEMYEMLEKGLLTEDEFREFTLENAVKLHAGMNPNFFAGTRIEAAAAEVLGSTATAVAG